MNILTGTARLSRDAEVRHLASGSAVCSFSAAMDSGYGESKSPVWLKMSLFGKIAEGGLPQYLKKGTQIAFSGELRVSEWDDKDGNKRTSVEVNLNKIDLIGGRGDSGQQDGGNQQQAPRNKQSDPFAEGGDFNSVPVDDSIPF